MLWPIEAFNIEEDLILCGVQLNIPPFMRGKTQLTETELVTTRRIASLRVHMERQMEKIKNFHIFDRQLPVQLTYYRQIFFLLCFDKFFITSLFSIITNNSLV